MSHGVPEAANGTLVCTACTGLPGHKAFCCLRYSVHRGRLALANPVEQVAESVEDLKPKCVARCEEFSVEPLAASQASRPLRQSRCARRDAASGRELPVCATACLDAVQGSLTCQMLRQRT